MITTRYALKIVVKYPDPSVLKLHFDKRRSSGERGVPFFYHLSEPPLAVFPVIDMVTNLKIANAPIHCMYF